MTIDNPALDRDPRAYQQRWWALTIVSLAWSITGLSGTILGVALPTLQRELHASASDLQWAMNAYYVAVAALLITMGAVVDRIGRANALRVGVVIFASGSLLPMAANSPLVIIGARAIMGMGAAIIMPAAFATIVQAFPIEERGKAVGIQSGIMGASMALGPVVGGLLIKYFSWQTIFLFNVPFAAIVLIGSTLVLSEKRNTNVAPVDIPGVFLSTLGLGTLVYALIDAGERGWNDNAVIFCFVAVTVLITLFILWERHTPKPMLDIGLFRNSHFSAGAVGVVLSTLMFTGLLFALTLYLQFVHGYSPLEAGIRFLPFGIGFVVGSITSPRQINRIGIKGTVSISFILMSAILVSASFWSAGIAYWILGFTIFAVTFCLGNAVPPSTASMVRSIPASRAGSASAMPPIAAQVGSSIGVALLGSILDKGYTSSIANSLAGKVTLSADTTVSLQQSVGSAMAVADKLPAETGEIVRAAARNSFMDGWQLMVLVACAIGAAAAIIALKFLPPRDRYPSP